MPVRVTVVDDDADVLDLFREILEGQGFAVETYADAMPGVRQLIRSQPDLIIVDLQLDPHREQLSGLQLVHAARSTRQLRNVPIIVCSADLPGLQAAWPDLEARGDIHQLSKPFNLAKFELLVATALGRPQRGKGAAGTGTLSAVDDSERTGGVP